MEPVCCVLSDGFKLFFGEKVHKHVAPQDCLQALQPLCFLGQLLPLLFQFLPPVVLALQLAVILLSCPKLRKGFIGFGFGLIVQPLRSLSTPLQKEGL